MTRSLAAELADRNIRINGVMPGLTVGASTRNVSADRWADYQGRQLFKRKQMPGDIEGVVAFLMSDDSRFMTGQMLCVDGGFALY
jgi:NAD(P)-dependent dehydrogenase (short-subunit alcohol dehydrogenase family)